MRIVNQLASLLWPLISAAAAIVLTPSLLISIFQGELAAAGACLLVLVPFYYILLSVYFEHLLERRFALPPAQRMRLQGDGPLWSDVILRYGASRRTMLHVALDTPGALLKGSAAGYRRLIVLHRALGWLFVAECVLLVVVLVAEQFQS